MSTDRITQNTWGNPWAPMILLMAQALSPDVGHAGRPPRRGVSLTPPAPRRGWLDRLEGWFWRQRQQSVEAWLSQSTDVFELESRMRSLERPYGSRYY